MRIAEVRFRHALLALLATLLPAAPVAAEEINSIILRVNDEIATRFEYEDRKNTRLGMIGEARDLHARLVPESECAASRTGLSHSSPLVVPSQGSRLSDPLLWEPVDGVGSASKTPVW